MAIIMSRKIERWLIALRVNRNCLPVVRCTEILLGLSPAEEVRSSPAHSCHLRDRCKYPVNCRPIYNRNHSHCTCTHVLYFAPLFLLPDLSFTSAPLSLTLVGQYIIKNNVIICALFVVDAAQQKE